jgi:hypothetical protein
MPMQKYKTLVTTQYLENYGAHSENGKFVDGNAYWKFKGGEQYVISSNFPFEANAVAFMSAYLQKDNDSRYGKQLVTDWEMLPEGWVEEDTFNEDSFTSPIYIDVEEYFELQKRVNKKRKAGGKISVDRSPAGMITASLAKAING